MKYEKIEKIQEAKIQLFEIFNRALDMAGYNIEEDSEMLCVKWAEAMMNLGTGIMQLENMCDADSLKLLEIINKCLDNTSQTC